MPRRALLFTPLLALLVTACVRGAPRLTPEQAERQDRITIYPRGETAPGGYVVVTDLQAADCHGGPRGTRLYGDPDKALAQLRAKAAAADADALIDVQCDATPLVNNCWHAQVCSGTAISYVH